MAFSFFHELTIGMNICSLSTYKRTDLKKNRWNMDLQYNIFTFRRKKVNFYINFFFHCIAAPEGCLKNSKSTHIMCSWNFNNFNSLNFI